MGALKDPDLPLKNFNGFAIYSQWEMTDEKWKEWDRVNNPKKNCLSGKRVEHIVFDVIPYWLWGNSIDDTAPLGNRITGN